jgi:hypothetical protein
MAILRSANGFMYDDTLRTFVGYKDRDGFETLFTFGGTPEAVFKKQNLPFLYSVATGKIVGLKHPNGTESFFTMGGTLTGSTFQRIGTPFLYDSVTRHIVGFQDGGVLSGQQFYPAFMQAAPLGYLGSFRSVSGHNSVSMYRAAADVSTVELIVSNAIIFATQNTSEAFPGDGLSLNVKCVLYAPTFPYSKTVRAFQAGGLAQGATSGTLAANAPGSTMEYVQLSNGDYRWMKYTGGSPNVTWDAPLSSAAAVNAQIWQMQNKGTFQFDGVSPGVLTGGQFSVLKSTISGLSIKKGDPVYVISYISRVGGGSFLLPGNQPANGTDVLNNGLLESYFDGADSTGTRFGSAPWYTVAQGANQFRPISLRGADLTNNTYQPIPVIGDSIASNPVSWVQQFLHSKSVPFVNLSKAGETAAAFISSSTVRVNALSNGTYLVEMGRNSWAVPGLQALWTYLRSKGATKIIQVLPPPQTTSGTSDWSSEATQNPDTATLGVNAQMIALLGQPNGPDVIWDTYTPCMGVDNQKWAAGYTGDGTHPGQLGINAILSYANTNNWINDLL